MTTGERCNAAHQPTDWFRVELPTSRLSGPRSRFKSPALCRLSERQKPDPPTFVSIKCRTFDIQWAHERAQGRPSMPRACDALSGEAAQVANRVGIHGDSRGNDTAELSSPIARNRVRPRRGLLHNWVKHTAGRSSTTATVPRPQSERRPTKQRDGKADAGRQGMLNQRIGDE